jgi:predicted DCC family thiol-disulfide oxidoreductase YuxK
MLEHMREARVSVDDGRGGPPLGRFDESGRYTVLYDGDCPICRGSVSRLEAKDREGILDFVPAKAPEVGEEFSWLSPDALREAVHVVGPDGKTWVGVEAMEELARVLPGWRWLSWALRVPLVRPLAERIYAWVARNRYSFFRT